MRPLDVFAGISQAVERIVPKARSSTLPLPISREAREEVARRAKINAGAEARRARLAGGNWIDRRPDWLAKER